MFKQIPNQIKSTTKSYNHETEARQATNRNKQANLSFPYLERASRKPRHLSYVYHSFENKSDELKKMAETYSKWVTMVNPG